MSVRFGVNPIGWSNDDLRELGGKTPLATCLKEAKEAGYEGIELGHKFPREPKPLKAVLRKAGLDLVSGWYSSALLKRSAKTEMKHLRPHLDLLKALGTQHPHLRRDLERHPRRPLQAAQQAAEAEGVGVEAVRPAHDRGRGSGRQGGRRPRLSPSHGNRGAERRGYRRLHEIDRAGGEAAAGYRPRHLRRRRSGRPGEEVPHPHRPRALQGCAQGCDGHRRGPRTGASSMPWSKAASRCRATAW